MKEVTQGLPLFSRYVYIIDGIMMELAAYCAEELAPVERVPAVHTPASSYDHGQSYSLWACQM